MSRGNARRWCGGRKAPLTWRAGRMGLVGMAPGAHPGGVHGGDPEAEALIGRRVGGDGAPPPRGPREPRQRGTPPSGRRRDPRLPGEVQQPHGRGLRQLE
eukprot:871342-Pyramimonas_sp.AAC.1